MDNYTPSVSIIMPALNEEANIGIAVDDTLTAFEEYGIKGEVIVINDGSIDNTPLIIKNKVEKFPGKVNMISHDIPKGIGASFWDGVDSAKGSLVCMLPGDNENDAREVLRYISLFKDVDLIIPFAFNKGARSLSRNIVSFLYKSIINTTFFTSLNYTNGTIAYKKALLLGLGHRCNSFFFQTDILIRLIKAGYLFVEVPYKLRRRVTGESKAISMHSLLAVIKGYARLVLDIYLKKSGGSIELHPESATCKRYKS